MTEASRESAVVNAEQTVRLDHHAERITRLEDAMSTVLENQAALNANVENLTTLLSSGIDMMKKGGGIIILLAAAALGVDATGMV